MTPETVSEAIGAPVRGLTRLQGGDLSEVFRVDMADGRRMALKHGAHVATEARMLNAMTLAGAPVPEVLHQTGRMLFLEWLDEAPASDAGWRALGEGLRLLHDTTGSDYGWPEAHAFGPLPLRNDPADRWPEFWAGARLRPFVPLLSGALPSRIEALAAALPERLPTHPAPALLHGDLWSGNALFGALRTWMIDPACYHGDAEVDLAMLELFTAPPAAFRQGYGATAPDRISRRAIYQLFPALVHLHLFGGGYAGLVDRLLTETGH